MARLFPFRSEPQTGEGQPRVVDLEGEDADAVFGALSSTTARRIYARLDDEPGTPSDVADAIDSSIQNVRYHLENLEDAGLVEVVDTWYSSRGNEMSVYATTNGPLIVTSDESRASQLRTALSRLLGGVGVLAGGSLLVQYGLTEWFGAAGSRSEEAAPAGSDDADDASATAPDETEDAGDETATDDAGDTRGGEGGTDGDESTDDGFTIADSEDETDRSETEETEAEDGTADGSDVGADGNESAGGNGADGTETVTDGGTDQFVDGGAETADAVFATVPPGLLFFLGGLAVLVAVTIYWYRYRPAY